MQRIRVDLPEPDGPMMQITSPLFTSRLIPFRTSTVPKDLWTSMSWTIGLSGVQAGGAVPAMVTESCSQRIWKRRSKRAVQRSIG